MKSKKYSATALGESAKQAWFLALNTKPPEEVIPKDFYTVIEIAQMRGRSCEQVRKILKHNVKIGSVVAQYFRIKNGNTVRQVCHYGPAPKDTHG